MNSNQVFSRVWDTFEAGEITVSCAWCGRIRLGREWFRPPPALVEAVDARLAFSHSICERCAEAYLPSPARVPTAWSKPRPRGT